uniref:Conotoxin superfamily Z n=1 Tax=Conus ermineus TaxID=55423 RepID=A0A346CJH1_CONER|nr:conotoxin precursor superfamily Z [Conus ermineus]
MHDIMNNNFTWGVFIILPVWLVYPPCQTTAPHGSQPAPPGRSSRGQCSNITVIRQSRDAHPTSAMGRRRCLFPFRHFTFGLPSKQDKSCALSRLHLPLLRLLVF